MWTIIWSHSDFNVILIPFQVHFIYSPAIYAGPTQSFSIVPPPSIAVNAK